MQSLNLPGRESWRFLCKGNILYKLEGEISQ